MIQVWMIIVACLAPDYTECRTLGQIRFVHPEVCQLQRPTMAGVYQLMVPHGWMTFTKCEFVNREKNGRKG